MPSGRRQTRQAARDRLHAEAPAKHAQELAENTRLLQEIHARVLDA